jgi:hypothetical protein
MIENATEEALLSLLAITVLADKRVYAVEIDSFVKMALSLNAQISFSEAVSEPKLLMWFELNRDNLRATIKTPAFKIWYNDCLETLASVPEKPQILEAMTQIAHADQDIHFGEIALITLTAKHWNIALPDLTSTKWDSAL